MNPIKTKMKMIRGKVYEICNDYPTTKSDVKNSVIYGGIPENQIVGNPLLSYRGKSFLEAYICEKRINRMFGKSVDF